MHIVDSHAHLDFDSYAEDLEAVLARSYEADIKSILSVGIGDGPDTMHRARDLAANYDALAPHDLSSPRARSSDLSSRPERSEEEKPAVSFPRIVASAGIHPQEAAHANETALNKLRDLATDKHVVAIGEIGLDYYHFDNPDIEVQQQAFLAQMQIALEANKPILIHCRTSELATPQAKARFGPADAQADLLRLTAENFASKGGIGVMHCFSGSADEARQALDLGFYLSFAGNVTYPRFPSIREAAQLVPADRYLVETDAPFLAPVPFRGQRNEPAHTRTTAEFVANLRNIPLDQLAEETTANFRRLFRVE